MEIPVQAERIKGYRRPKGDDGGTLFALDVTGNMEMPGQDGKMKNMTFKGMGIEGYDNVKKKFVGSWVDNMGTGIMTSEGDYDAATKTFTYTGEVEMIPGMKQKIREVLKVVDKDHHTLSGTKIVAARKPRRWRLTIPARSSRRSSTTSQLTRLSFIRAHLGRVSRSRLREIRLRPVADQLRLAHEIRVPQHPAIAGPLGTGARKVVKQSMSRRPRQLTSSWQTQIRPLPAQ